MKTIRLIKSILILGIPAVLLSCGILPVNYSGSRSWHVPHRESDKAVKKTWTTIDFLGVHTDVTGGWYSLENETSVLAPLFFWNRGCKVVTKEENPRYAARINLREREFLHGWRTKRSLAVEVCFWAYDEIPDGQQVPDQALPVAAARSILLSGLSFSSSGTTEHLLYKTIKKATRKLAAYERNINKMAAEKENN